MDTPVEAAPKDPEKQHPVPHVWRGTLAAVVDALKEGDFQLARGIPGVPKLAKGIAQDIEANINDYGARLVSLPEETWHSSACQWMGSYWDVLVDLFAEEEGLSDLALSVRIREFAGGYSFEVLSVHVP